MLVSKLREINIYLSDEEIKLCGLWMAVQAMRAEERVREWGGRSDALPSSAAKVAPAVQHADPSSNATPI